MRKIFGKGKTGLLGLIIVVSAISLDFMVSEFAAEAGTFRLESEFVAVQNDTTTVSIVPSDYAGLASPVARSANLTYEQVEAMVRKAIELQGGLQGVVKKGDKVMLKVNLVGQNSPSGQGENTDVRVVKAAIKIISEFCNGDVRFQVAEGTARSNDDPKATGSVWANSGYTDLLTDTYLSGIQIELLNINQTYADMVQVDLGAKSVNGKQGSKYFVHKAILDADVYIAVPVHKIHDTGMTNALKLQIGIAPGCIYGYNKMKGSTYSDPLYHGVTHRRWQSEAIVDLSTIADIDFVITDALMCLQSKKSYDGSNQLRMNTIVAGKDPVAVDHVCTKLFDMNPDDIDHITLAEKVGLGTNDPEKIILKGATIESTKKPAKKEVSQQGTFGQSNRNWILSQPFAGTNITTEYIANEASLKPEPGKNGWSQPVYFFDDRIDLLNFYNGATNIVTYAYTNFFAPKAQTAELWLGTQEAIYVYLNGELAYSFNSTQTYGDADLGKKVKNIEIKAGENALLVKSLNKTGDYSFGLNICEVESNSVYSGNRVDGLAFYQSAVTGNVKVMDAGVKNLKCYPNPATTQATIRFAVPSKENVLVQIFDTKGALINTLNNSRLPAGTHEFLWDLTAYNQKQVKPGIYVCNVLCGSLKSTEKIVVE
jgi:uncharacterized protein (DUF362 family)